MVYLILDTNAWIYLANGDMISKSSKRSDHHFKLLAKLKEVTSNGTVTVLTNRIIIDEFDRNLSNAESHIERLKTRNAGRNSPFIEVRKYVKDENLLIPVEREYEKALLRDIIRNKNHVDEVRTFLRSNCVIVDVHDNIFIRASRLALEKRAPFHKGRNSFADACILLSAFSYLEFVKLAPHDIAIFVSNNISDFCDQRNTDQFHSDIARLIKGHLKIDFKRFLAECFSQVDNHFESFSSSYEEYVLSLNRTYICTEWRCSYKSDYSGLFKSLALKVSDFEVFYDPNQLVLFNLNNRDHIAKRYIRIGECSICETIHLECPNCGSLISQFEVNRKEVCDNCEAEFILNQDMSIITVLTPS